MGKPKKPSAPREIVAPEIEERRAERKRLEGQGAEVSIDRDETVLGAFKPDVVTMMARASSISAEEESAVRRLERAICKTHDGGGSCLSSLERVGGQSAGDPTLAAVIRHTEAASALDELRRHMDGLTWGLLRELCDGNLILTRWRDVVQRRTGERNDKAQGGVVRQAFRVLVSAEIAAKEERKRRPANDAQADAVALAG